MGDGGWEQERHTAKRVIDSLKLERELQHSKRRWILRNWPEPSDKESKKVLASTEMCIPESFLREHENPSVKSINDLVAKSLYDLRAITWIMDDLPNGGADTRMSLDEVRSETIETQTESIVAQIPTDVSHTQTADTSEGERSDTRRKHRIRESLDLDELSDLEIARSLPLVLVTLPIKALQSIYSTLSGASGAYQNREWLEKCIKQLVAGHLQEGEDTVPEVVSRAIKIMRNNRLERRCMSTGKLLALPPRPFQAIESALDQVESLPLRTLHAMYDLMFSKPKVKVRLRHSVTGANRARLANSLRKKAADLMEDMNEDGPLPDPLKKAMYAMSLSARELGGDDGNLGFIIGRPSLDVEAVHNKLLSALLQLKKLRFKGLASLSRLVDSQPVKSYCKQHPNYIRSYIRSNLVDFLLRCDDPKVPEPIQRTIDAIGAVRESPKVKKRRGTLGSTGSRKRRWRKGERNGAEVEAVLCVSSHLEQIWRDKEEVKEQRAQAQVKVEVLEQGDAEAVGGLECAVEEGNEGSEAETGEILKAADEAGALCYVMLGRAFGEISSSKENRLPTCVQKYLHCHDEETAGQEDTLGNKEDAGKPIDETALLVEIAESLPYMSARSIFDDGAMLIQVVRVLSA